jgi:ElaB/YqjD/DUF883 family membrane-anchored ribosome-binding protein
VIFRNSRQPIRLDRPQQRPFHEPAAADRNKAANDAFSPISPKTKECTMATASEKTAKNENGANRSVEDLETEIAALRADIAKLTEDLAALGKASINTARRAASQGAEQLRSQGEAAIADLKANAADFEAQLVEAVREKPVTALAIAAGVGFLFALIARR